MNQTKKETKQDVICNDLIAEKSRESKDDMQIALEAMGYSGKELTADDLPPPAFIEDDGEPLDIPPIICVGKSDVTETENKESEADVQSVIKAFGYSDEAVDDDDDLEVAFLDDDGPSADIPPHICKTNIMELYGWQPGESLEKAIKRSIKEK